ncbi:Ribosome biogenesis ATPase rix7 [Saxophila tyrrhenica]|uniref:Ribosome biogenesis ATPase rix7 n=1 Tax=Saxophila tyrrhenica TaxID=1690608 RepID=A0AAV9P6R7_9PEZI|nr:Ribosome biogenesis ATPase rix7 [Saxophila tyrrhenica]
MARLQGALDNEVHVAVQRFLQDGAKPDVDVLYTAIQKSNSSLKRRPKKLLHGSLERVLDFLDVKESSDSEAEIEQRVLSTATDASAMNRSLRMNLAAPSSPQPVNGDQPQKRQRLPNGEPVLKRRKPDAASTAPPEGLSLRDIGGMNEVLGQLKKSLVWPLLFPGKYNAMKVKLPNGILLHGPPGCGKTMISRALASAMGLPFVEILGPSIVSGMSGESEKAIRERFDEAKRNAPCLIFMDEIDAIAPKRDTSQSQMEKRIVAQLLVSMDELERDTTKPVMVLATTNRPDSLDPALRRGGRFDTEINIGVPNEQVRRSILQAQTREAPLADDVDFKKLAKMTAGFVGADLHDLVSKAGSWQLERYFTAMENQVYEQSMNLDHSEEVDSIYNIIKRATRNDLEEPDEYDMSMTMEAFLAVLPAITPSSKREGFATIPDVSWNDIGALENVRKELQVAIVEPITHPEKYAALGITSPSGVLLWGPPGCGKTLLAKAAAAESKANFISVKGPELLNKFVGESEAAVRRVFTRARSSVPCVIFFDELDALVPRRGEEGSEASSRVVNTLLTELDGLDDREGIYVIGATNRPDVIDDAMLRPGRLGTRLFVDLPGANERAEILRALVRGRPIASLEKVDDIARGCEGFSGADLKALLRAAGESAILREASSVDEHDFEYARGKVAGSVGNMDKYYRLKKKFGNR